MAPLWRLRQLLVVALVVLVLHGLLTIWLVSTSRCTMSSALFTLLSTVIQVLDTTNTPYVAAFGTLLGTIREGHPIPFEYDVDLAIMDSKCNDVADMMKKDINIINKQYEVYGQSDVIERKRNWLLGYSPYITTPCVRVYDHSEAHLYVDIYWMTHIADIETIRNGIATGLTGGQIRWEAMAVQEHTSTGGGVLCNDESITLEGPAGCVPYTWVWPSQTRILHSEATLAPASHTLLEDSTHNTQIRNIAIRIPAQAEKILEAHYGPSWRTPQAKGYKRFVCPIVLVPEPFTATQMMFVYGATAAMLVGCLWAMEKPTRFRRRFFEVPSRVVRALYQSPRPVVRVAVA